MNDDPDRNVAISIALSGCNIFYVGFLLLVRGLVPDSPKRVTKVLNKTRPSVMVSI